VYIPPPPSHLEESLHCLLLILQTVTPLDLAVNGGHAEVVDLLLRRTKFVYPQEVCFLTLLFVLSGEVYVSFSFFSSSAFFAVRRKWVTVPSCAFSFATPVPT
jgi:hypothetical protein